MKVLLIVYFIPMMNAVQLIQDGVKWLVYFKKYKDGSSNSEYAPPQAFEQDKCKDDFLKGPISHKKFKSCHAVVISNHTLITTSTCIIHGGGQAYFFHLNTTESRKGKVISIQNVFTLSNKSEVEVIDLRPSEVTFEQHPLRMPANEREENVENTLNSCYIHSWGKNSLYEGMVKKEVEFVRYQTCKEMWAKYGVKIHESDLCISNQADLLCPFTIDGAPLVCTNIAGKSPYLAGIAVKVMPTKSLKQHLPIIVKGLKLHQDGVNWLVYFKRYKDNATNNQFEYTPPQAFERDDCTDKSRKESNSNKSYQACHGVVLKKYAVLTTSTCVNEAAGSGFAHFFYMNGSASENGKTIKMQNYFSKRKESEPVVLDLRPSEITFQQYPLSRPVNDREENIENPLNSCFLHSWGKNMLYEGMVKKEVEFVSVKECKKMWAKYGGKVNDHDFCISNQADSICPHTVDGAPVVCRNIAGKQPYLAGLAIKMLPAKSLSNHLPIVVRVYREDKDARSESSSRINNCQLANIMSLLSLLSCLSGIIKTERF